MLNRQQALAHGVSGRMLGGLLNHLLAVLHCSWTTRACLDCIWSLSGAVLDGQQALARRVPSRVLCRLLCQLPLQPSETSTKACLDCVRGRRCVVLNGQQTLKRFVSGKLPHCLLRQLAQQTAEVSV